jgi:hypothetical protein
MTDTSGLILEILNSPHPSPGELINKSIESLFVDSGSVDEFRRISKKVLADCKTRTFTCQVDFSGQKERRQYRVMECNGGLMLINHKVEDV